MLTSALFILSLLPFMILCAPSPHDYISSYSVHQPDDLSLNQAARSAPQAAPVSRTLQHDDTHEGSEESGSEVRRAPSLLDGLIPSGGSSSPSSSVLNAASVAGSQQLVMTYYPDWAADTLPPENVDVSLFDVIDFAFAIPNQKFDLTFDRTDSHDLLRRLVSTVHAGGKKVKLSIGGWTGSGDFSQAVANPQNRETLVQNTIKMYKQYGLDGIDIDWEYPGQQGASGNGVSSSDTSNMLAFLQLLRSNLPNGALLTAAVQTELFAGSNQEPIQNASPFAGVLDWVLIMNYDTYEMTTPPGPNAPLSNGCGNSTQPNTNAVAGYNAWTKAGFPASQIVLGVPSYGYVIHSDATRLRQRSSIRRSLYHMSHLSRRGAAVADDGSGQIQFSHLVSQGILVRDSDGTFAAGDGFQRIWDQCSSTPFLRSASAEQVIPYDDPYSLGLKAAFVKQKAMKGVSMFDVHGDTSQWDLTNALRNTFVA